MLGYMKANINKKGVTPNNGKENNEKSKYIQNFVLYIFRKYTLN